MNSLRNLLVIFGGQDDSNTLLNDLVVFNTEELEWYFARYKGSTR